MPYKGTDVSRTMLSSQIDKVEVCGYKEMEMKQNQFFLVKKCTYNFWKVIDSPIFKKILIIIFWIALTASFFSTEKSHLTMDKKEFRLS